MGIVQATGPRKDHIDLRDGGKVVEQHIQPDMIKPTSITISSPMWYTSTAEMACTARKRETKYRTRLISSGSARRPETVPQSELPTMGRWADMTHD